MLKGDFPWLAAIITEKKIKKHFYYKFHKLSLKLLFTAKHIQTAPLWGKSNQNMISFLVF